MRVKEMYGWYFPELQCENSYDLVNAIDILWNIKNVSNDLFLERINKLKEKEVKISTSGNEDFTNIETYIKLIISNSIGSELSEVDWNTLRSILDILINKIEIKKKLEGVLSKNTKTQIPNLEAILGHTFAARLVQKAGGLMNLSKSPASTIQLLGSEKSLFRALKTKTATPKFGFLFNHSFIGRAKNKARISRFLATKCSIASRIDCFGGKTNEYGEAMKKLIEKKLVTDDVETTESVLEKVYKKIQNIKKD